MRGHFVEYQLCLALKEASRWWDTLDAFDRPNNTTTMFPEMRRISELGVKIRAMNQNFSTGSTWVPAYNLDYLIRKLPSGSSILKHDDTEYVGIYTPSFPAGEEASIKAYSESPQDAAAHLAIKLLKAGVLEPDSEELA